MPVSGRYHRCPAVDGRVGAPGTAVTSKGMIQTLEAAHGR
jgi:hypothetical protein